jgi:GNAT superfamily N-acetyltransferase
VTGSTEHRLGVEHLAGCLALSRSAGWNQNEADWRLMLGMGHGWGISLQGGTLAASTLVLLYGKNFAWVSMVLVLPEHRRKGYASRLLRVALADLERRGLTPILDATPAGREVYRQEGFQDTWGFKRYVLANTHESKALKSKVRPLRDQDWSWILELDGQAFGASREPLLRSLAQRLPEAALVVERSGFILGREGREARQVGPLIASDRQTATNLLSQALAAVQAPLYLDLVDHAPTPTGATFQRPFTRMVHGAARAPGNEKLVYCVAGPELG